MSKETYVVTCFFCFTTFDSYYKVFTPGAIEVCPDCEQEFELADTEEEEAERICQAKREDAERGAATHVRIMAKGEDGAEFCIKNYITKELGEDLLNYILAGTQTSYPEAKLWFEDEESTSLLYRRAMMRELEYDPEY